MPEPYFAHNNRSAIANSSFVEESITQLLKEGRIHECSRKPIAVNPLSVSIQASSKKRLILDLRKVNLHLWKQLFKFEDLKTTRLYLEKGKFLFSFDLKSGIHHIDIFPAHTDYLGFSWAIGPITKYYKFLVLPFGLSSAPYIFSKIMRVLVKKWRSEGKEIIVYLDDGLGLGNSLSEAKTHSQAVHNDLIQAGFITNEEKSYWNPQQYCQWLGFILDTSKGVIGPVHSKLLRIIDSITWVKLSGVKILNVKTLASLIGQIIAMSPALGNVTRLMTRSMLTNVQTAETWYSSILLSTETMGELQFWEQNILNLKAIPMKTDCTFQKVVYSDASGVGAGGYIVEVSGALAHGSWDENQRHKSSTWRELKAVQIILKSFIPLLAGSSVKWFTDSQNVVRIIEVGSGKTELQEMAYSIFALCVEHGISLKVDWVPRSLNDKADHLSRIIDYDDWALSDYLFNRFEKIWGMHTVDRFASSSNTKLPRFNSRYWNPGSESVDTFTCYWANENNWLVPPISLIAKTILHLKANKASGTLIIPNWPSAPFWSLLIDAGTGSFRTEVIDLRFFPAYSASFITGHSNRALFKENFPSFKMIAIRLSFCSQGIYKLVRC